MALVTINNVEKEYSGRQILDNVSFEINPGQKYGLIGPNGCGKTTMLKIMCGILPPDSGKVDLATGTRIGYVPQYVEFDGDDTVIDCLMREYRTLHAKLRDIEKKVSDHSGDDMDLLLKEYQIIRDEYDHYGGDHFQTRAESMIDALGLAGRTSQKVSQLSGGEKNVLAMCRALLADPNLLVLDEPGNHLDYMGLAWLDEYLKKFRGAILIVSHNRYLLDRIATGILEIEDAKMTAYPGNYTAYKKIKAEELAAQQAQFKAYQQRLAHIEALVQKFADIAQGHASDQSWGKRLRSRRSQLEREKANAVEAPKAEAKKIKATFQADVTKADIALQVRQYSKAFGDLELIDNVDFDVAGGERWALVGPNGCGKTSMLRDIIEFGKWEGETIRIGPSLSIGYCSQGQEVLTGNNTVYEELASIKDVNHQKVLGMLARFLFNDEEVHKRISDLSGGERNRLQLAKLMLTQPNFLIMDEPTNHLDIKTREAVEDALIDYEGTLLVVSHDRYFLDRVVNHIAEIQDKKLKFYSGNFTNYWQSCHEQMEKVSGRVVTRGKDRQRDEDDNPNSGGQAWKDRKAQAAAQRKLQRAVEVIEEKIAKAEDKRDEMHTGISDAFTSGDNDLGAKLSIELKELVAQIELLYEQWEEAAAKI